MSTRRIQVILTDIGRVVLDVHEERAIERLTELSGIDVARLWSVLIAGPDIERHVQTGQSSMRDIYGTHLGEMHASVSYDEFAEALTTELGDDYPQVRRAYESLPPDVPLYTLSNTNDVHMVALREHWLFDLSKGYWASNEIGMVKPDRETFEWVLAQIGLPAEAVLFFDDRQDNIQAAGELGIQGVQVTHPDVVVAALAERLAPG